MHKIVLVLALILIVSLLFINPAISSKDDLYKNLSDKGLSAGDHIFMRIFKAEKVLELWMKSESSDQFILFKSYPICTFSGELGPKTAQGDRQSPEGFYAVGLKQLNPNSKFHKSFNLGYPNAYDRAQGYTGDFLMVHGNCVSIGCYAMTDKLIDEIYLIAQKALENGQPFFRVHAFPFRLTSDNLKKYSAHKWSAFWEMQKPIYDLFELTKIPPDVSVIDGRYITESDRSLQN